MRPLSLIGCFVYLFFFFLFNFNSGNIFFKTEDDVNDPDPINSNKLSLFLHLYSSIALLIAFSEYSNSSISKGFRRNVVNL